MVDVNLNGNILPNRFKCDIVHKLLVFKYCLMINCDRSGLYEYARDIFC